MPTVTVLRTEVAGAVGESVVVGTEMELVISGTLVAAPDEARLVITVPLVPGATVLRLGRICTMPELTETVVTKTLATTVVVVTDWKKIAAEDADTEGTSGLLGREV